jgi:uncharacterized protein (TIGR04255 family)
MGKYRNAPIREAILDIRVSPREDLALDELRALSAQAADFPKVEDQYVINAAIQVGAEASRSITPVKHGFVFTSVERNQIFVAQSAGFSFSQLAPYDSWKVFVAQAREIWKNYHALARPKALTRVALRYVNRLEIPVPFADFEEYLRIAPQIPKEMPQGISHFFNQYQIPYQEIGALAVLNIGMIEAPANGMLPILLDIDIFKDRNVPQEEAEVWEYFEALRITKNSVFESAITEKMKARFGHG